MPNALFLSRNTIKSQAYSLYRKLGASTRNQAVTRSVNWDSWRVDHPPGRKHDPLRVRARGAG